MLVRQQNYSVPEGQPWFVIQYLETLSVLQGILDSGTQIKLTVHLNGQAKSKTWFKQCLVTYGVLEKRLETGSTFGATNVTKVSES